MRRGSLAQPSIVDAHALQCVGLRGMAMVISSMVLSACALERVEYVDVPEYYFKAAPGGLPDRVVLDDGTVRVYRVRGKETALARKEGPTKQFELREKDAAGKVKLNALLPEHVIAHLMACLQSEEYELFYEQMLSQVTRDELAGRGEGFEEFEQFLSVNRRELMATLNRMLFGFSVRDVSIDRLEGNVIRCRLRPHVAGEFRFRAVLVRPEQGQMRLVTIK